MMAYILYYLYIMYCMLYVIILIFIDVHSRADYVVSLFGQASHKPNTCNVVFEV